MIVASLFMERAAVSGGTSLGLEPAVTGGVVLAAVTSLPNLVAAVYLARTGKATAMLSEAMNSNTINIVGGLMLPAIISGLSFSRTGGGAQWTAGFYVAMALLALGLAYWGKGLGRRAGALLIAVYGAFVAGLLAVS